MLSDDQPPPSGAAAAVRHATAATDERLGSESLGPLDGDDEPRLLQSFCGHGGEAKTCFTTCAFVPVRRQIAVGTQDGAVLAWPLDAQERSRPTKFGGGGQSGAQATQVTCVASSGDGDLLAASFMDGAVKLWRNQAGRQVPSVLKLHFSAARACDISPRGAQLLLSCSDDKLVKLSALPDRRFVASLVGHSNWVKSAVFGRTGDLVASGSDDKTVRLWDVEHRSSVRVWHDHASSVTCVRFDSSGSTVAGCSWDSTINLWDVRSHALRQHYARAHGTSPVTHIALHPSEDVLLSASTDRTLRLWDLRAGRLRYTVRGHERPGIYACAWDDQGSRFASCDNQLVHLWVLPSGSKATSAIEPSPARPSMAPCTQRRGSSIEASSMETLSAAVAEAEAGPMPTRRRAGIRAASAADTSRGLRGAPDLWRNRPVTPGTLPPQKALPRSGRLACEGYETSATPQTIRGDGGAAAPAAAVAAAAATSARCGNGVPEFVPAPVGAPKEQLEEAVARMLEQMVSQMDVLTRSLQSMECRVQSTEEALGELAMIAKLRRRSADSMAAPIDLVSRGC